MIWAIIYVMGLIVMVLRLKDRKPDITMTGNRDIDMDALWAYKAGKITCCIFWPLSSILFFGLWLKAVIDDWKFEHGL